MIESFLLQVNKPGRYIGGEWNVSRKEFAAAEVKFALCFPDLYEVGMSNLGIRILYGLLNNMPGVCCERFFSYAADLENIIRAQRLEAFSLESRRPMKEFDIVGFSLGSELGYTNVLRMLDLGGVALDASLRGNKEPLVIGGGPCVLNPEPVCRFFDLFIIGEAEEALPELVEAYRRHKQDYRSGKMSKEELLSELAGIQGVYAPALYEVAYGSQGQLEYFRPRVQQAPERIKKRVLADLNVSFFPTQWLVPYIQIVHDRLTLEIARGCPNRCRFCQARYQYYPYRLRGVENTLSLAQESYRNTGYEEISLCGLSVSDYPEIVPLLRQLVAIFREKAVSISLPSIKAKTLVGEAAALIATIKKTGLTFAPEAGTPKLRDILGKDFNEEEFFAALRQSYLSGYQHVKLYFMLGLPGEEISDLDGIADFSLRASQAGRAQGRGATQVNLSVNNFIPKPHTPLQWSGMPGIEAIREKQAYLKSRIKSRRVRASFADARVSFLEGVLSRGDRRLAQVILEAYKAGASFDAWSDHFDFQKWEGAFTASGLDPAIYLQEKDASCILPWDHIDVGVDKKTLLQEFAQSRQQRSRKNHCHNLIDDI